MIADMLGMNRITVAKKFKGLRDISHAEQINGFLCIKGLRVTAAYGSDEVEIIIWCEMTKRRPLKEASICVSQLIRLSCLK